MGESAVDDEGDERRRDVSEWDACAAEWDDDEAARAYAAAAFDSLIATAAGRGVPIAGGRVCDFGCGTGLLTERLAPLVTHIDAVDTSPAMLDVLREKAERNGWTNVSTMADPPSSAGAHDLIVCSSVCGFLDDYPATVARLGASLRPGGLFVQWDWERDDDDADPHGLGRSEIHAALTDAGLVGVAVETAFEVDAGGQVMRPLIGVGAKAGERPARRLSPHDEGTP